MEKAEPLSAEWMEESLRAALLEDGRRLLEQMVQMPEPEVKRVPGQRVYSQRPCEVLSIFGPIRICRNYYHPAGPEGSFPFDRALGLMGGFTPAAARMLSRTAAQLPYLESSQQLEELAGLKVDPSQIQRLVNEVGGKAQLLLPSLGAVGTQNEERFYISVDGTGVPMMAECVRLGEAPLSRRANGQQLGSLLEGLPCMMGKLTVCWLRPEPRRAKHPQRTCRRN